jgi:hypothetical protein
MREACRVLDLPERRAYRWLDRRAGGRLDDKAPGGSPMHGLLPEEVAVILALFEEWGETDRSHRKLAHRGSYLGRAADLLTKSADPARAEIMQVTDLDPDKHRVDGSWLDHLALWAERYPDLTALDRCVVKLSAPELAGEELVSAAELAQAAGIAASTLRAYMARGEGDLPAPQAMVGGRAMWSRPVAEEWAEQRRRDPVLRPATVLLLRRGHGDLH